MVNRRTLVALSFLARYCVADMVSLFIYNRPYTAADGEDTGFPDNSTIYATFASAMWKDDTSYMQGYSHSAKGVNIIALQQDSLLPHPLGAALEECPDSEFHVDRYDVSKVLSTGIEVYLKFRPQSVLVAMICPTAGACAFGPSPDSMMAGTDAAVGWIDDATGEATLLDVYAGMPHVMPTTDALQDVELEVYYQGDMDTCASSPTASPTAAPQTPDDTVSPTAAPTAAPSAYDYNTYAPSTAPVSASSSAIL